MLKNLVFLGVLLMILSCGRDDQREREIAGIPVEVELSRFDERFGNATVDSLPGLKRDFPYLFPEQYDDQVWMEMINDTLQQELHEEVGKKFPELSGLKEELRSLFQHIRFYFPEREVPEVVTLVSEVDYRRKVIWADSLLLVSLDTYLGKEHYFYEGIQEYQKEDFEEELIVSDAAAAFAETVVPKPGSRTFLEEMIYFGKMLYLKDRLIPFKSDHQKIAYTEEELKWAQANEDQIWRYFVEKELLFDTDPQLASRFLYPAPFSKFYLELDSDSPAELGQYLGWQIVRQYMERNEVPLREMLSMDGEEIFNNSNYKPKR